MRSPYSLVTGGAGFIGVNLASRLADEGRRVLVFDNLSRAGVRRNLEWLLKRYPSQVEFYEGDVRDPQQVNEAVAGAESVFHLAAQVAVTTSMLDPVTDFEINARGTLNVLEAVRNRRDRPFVLYTSTNKVLGGLEFLRLLEGDRRYEPVDSEIRDHGVGETHGIEFCSPYGCSKGAADQYVLDYARCFDIPAVVFRMSCIYGPHQCGNEDQGWVAHFVAQALRGETITFYGNGKQVRDALFVDDLIQAFLIAERERERLKGNPFIMGGGPLNSISLIELVDRISELAGRSIEVRKEAWRPSDQRYFVSDTRGFSKMSGWAPQVGVQEGLSRLFDWMS